MVFGCMDLEENIHPSITCTTHTHLVRQQRVEDHIGQHRQKDEAERLGVRLPEEAASALAPQSVGLLSLAGGEEETELCVCVLGVRARAHLRKGGGGCMDDWMGGMDG